MTKYNHRKIESKWQEAWQKAKLYLTRDEVKGKENYYTLVEFPYPSGNLHVGHWYAFSVPDIFARFMRMRGKNVLYPIGFDAFGLPAENAAIKHKLNPRKWTLGNIEYMKKQIATMGASFDWSREVVTCEPEYYKWNQWIFSQFFKKGLAYQAETPVNWCPSCKTVLANEQVINGLCERCDTAVEQRKMKQWQLRITNYAERLLDGLNKLDWPEEIKESQRNWIGKSEGAEISFPIVIPAKAGIQKFVLLHGFDGNPETGVFFPWLIKELKARGYEVEAPQLPNPGSPKEEGQVNYVLRHCKFDSQTVLFGHSLGAVVAMKVAEKLKTKIGGLVLAGGFVEHNFKDRPRPFEKTFRWEFDFAKIKQNVGFVKILSSLDDYAVPVEQGKILKKKLDGQLIEAFGEKPHFTDAKEPVILESLIPHPASGHPLPQAGEGLGVRVFTTRPDTIFGATYMVLAPEHPMVQDLGKGEVMEYIEKAKRKTEMQRLAVEKDKTGVELKGVKAINPATGEEIPVWVADYVLMNYGTGAIMAVPAHDERDRAFAKKYDLPIRVVVLPITRSIQYPTPAEQIENVEIQNIENERAYSGNGYLINSQGFNRQHSEKAKAEIVKFVGGRIKTQYKLRDWVISRQRYWGTPIPIIHCPDCGPQAVADRDLPVVLPEIKDYKPRGDGKSPLAKVEKWVKVKCPKCRQPAERETDTMDTFVDSAWYFLRYTDPKNRKTFAAKEKMKKWMPVNRYSGGAEHTTMHLLYSRFWIKAMHDLGLVSWDEPYEARMNRGLILGPDGQKMSKSRGNVVDPDKMVRDLGADTVRMYLAFIGPYNEVGAYPWNPQGIMGVRRFLEKVWRLGSNAPQPPLKVRGGEGELWTKIHKTIKKVTEDTEAFKFNTAISAMMILLNEFSTSSNNIGKGEFETFLKILAPFAPHLAEEMWSQLGHKKSIHLEPWPEYDEKLIKDEKVKVAVQVNGKFRATVQLPRDASQEDAKAAAEKDENVMKYFDGRKVRKVIYVPGKIINFVI